MTTHVLVSSLTSIEFIQTRLQLIGISFKAQLPNHRYDHLIRSKVESVEILWLSCVYTQNRNQTDQRNDGIGAKCFPLVIFRQKNGQQDATHKTTQVTKQADSR